MLKYIIMKLKELLELSKGSCYIHGLWGSARGWFLNEWVKYYKRPILIITKGPYAAEEIFLDLKTFSKQDIAIFPEAEPEVLDSLGQRWQVLECIPSVIVTSIRAVRQGVIPPSEISNIRIGLNIGAKIVRIELFRWLLENGYERADCAEVKGEFAHRGGIIDIYPVNSDLPVRIELNSDVIESVRSFHPQSQCSLPKGKIPSYIYPIKNKNINDSLVTFDEYLSRDAVIVLDDLNEDIEFDTMDKMVLNSLVKADNGLSAGTHSLHHISVEKMGIDMLTVARERISKQLSDWVKWEYKVYIWCNNIGERERLEEMLKDRGYIDKLHLGIGHISRGFLYPDERLVVVSDEEIFGRYKIRLPVRKLKGYTAPIKQFAELRTGDYVVHIDQGIGRYLGIKKEKGREMMVIQYADKARLYIPISDAYLIEKYIGFGRRPPKLSSLSGSRWMKTKIKIEHMLMDTAAELLDIQAKRQAVPGTAFAEDTLLENEMEDAFIYEETADQLQAVQEVKKDMQRPMPMDRLICGDVGYGKTEVAIRAAFKAVMNGMQTAVLVPTTILAQQHYRTFSDRLADYPVFIEMLSRFRTVQQQKKIIQKLAEGRVDIIIGTHRLIQPDVKFKNLGLVIIDEEQRFGVRHKERFKKMRSLVDVLTLTATPIPRTLYMSLAGIKDMSVINTPPQDRLAVKTIIIEYNEQIIREAVLKEINREGQVYFLHNRVENIDKVAERLQRLIPEARFLTAHGQMDGELLEAIMNKFVEGKANVLVCTTIIQSGMDIPNVNTIIINDADRFGLADLYQLRGRVGRFDRQAYAYLMLSHSRILISSAQKRLKAIQDFSQLGSGFKIAMQDLEIRGAGNILGAQQHGYIQAVGFELYCKLLRVNILKLQGKPVENIYEVKLDIGVDGYIPMEYIPADRIRIEFYKRLAGAIQIKELEGIKAELVDRFGLLPKSVNALLDIAEIKLLARKAGIKKIKKIADNKILITGIDGKSIIYKIFGKGELQWFKEKIYDIMSL